MPKMGTNYAKNGSKLCLNIEKFEEKSRFLKQKSQFIYYFMIQSIPEGRVNDFVACPTVRPPVLITERLCNEKFQYL